MLSIQRVSGRRLIRAMSSSALSIRPPSLDEETAQFNQNVSEMANFFSSPRFSSIKRPYSPSDVVSKQGSLPALPLPSTLLADKLFSLLSEAAQAGQPVHTMGAIDPVQMTQMAPFQQVVYVSGWAASSVLTTGNNEVGPDLGCGAFLCAFVPNSLILLLGTTLTPPSPTKSIGYSVLNNSMTKNIMTKECLLQLTFGVQCSTSIISDQLSQMQTLGRNFSLGQWLNSRKNRHGGLSAVMKLVKLFAESVCIKSGLRPSRLNLL